jgi:hypothetical protein
MKISNIVIRFTGRKESDLLNNIVSQICKIVASSNPGEPQRKKSEPGRIKAYQEKATRRWSRCEHALPIKRRTEIDN